MNISQYYHDQLVKIESYRDMLMSRGYNASLIVTLNRMLREFALTLAEYDAELKAYQNSPMHRNTAFGSNQYELDIMLASLEQYNKKMNTILNGIAELDTENRQVDTLTSIFTPKEPVCINNSRNIFPECTPIDATPAESNLYLIKDKELENYQIMYTKFDEIVLELYNKVMDRCKTEDKIDELSGLNYIHEEIIKVLPLIDMAIEDRDFYNVHCENCIESNPNYHQLEIYGTESYPNIIQKLGEILQRNSSKYDHIIDCLQYH